MEESDETVDAVVEVTVRAHVLGVGLGERSKGRGQVGLSWGLGTAQPDGDDEDPLLIGGLLIVALKLKAIGLARKLGAHTVVTQNHQDNPMSDLNRRLGFIEVNSMTEYVRQLDQKKLQPADLDKA